MGHRGPFPDEEDSWLLGLYWGCQGERWEPAVEQSVYPMPGSTGGRGSQVHSPCVTFTKLQLFPPLLPNAEKRLTTKAMVCRNTQPNPLLLQGMVRREDQRTSHPHPTPTHLLPPCKRKGHFKLGGTPATPALRTGGRGIVVSLMPA